MKHKAKTIAALNDIKAKLQNGFWGMSNNARKQFENRISTFLQSSYMVDDSDNDPEDMTEADAQSTLILDQIAVVEVQGDIYYNTGLSEDECEFFGICDIVQLFNQLSILKDNPTISTLILDINSSGGSAQLNEVVALIKEISATKDVIAFGSGMVASAAYYIASACDEIVITPSCWIGAVGACYERLDLTQYNKNEGIAFELIASSPKKFWGDPNTPCSPEEKAWLNDTISRITTEFKDFVKANRTIDDTLLDGSIFQGKEAITNNFTDSNANSLNEVIKNVTESQSK